MMRHLYWLLRLALNTAAQEPAPVFHDLKSERRDKSWEGEIVITGSARKEMT
jgi:hypothetical protein